MDPLTLGAISSGIGMIAGYAQYRKGQKEAKKLDELGLESMAEATLPEYRDVEAKYRQISETGLGAAEINEFMKRAQTSMYAQQMGAQTMAGGSLARYTLAMNNANYLNQMGILAGQQFQRRMQGLTGYERQLGMRQARTDADIQMENQRRLAAGQAAANLSAQGLQNIIGGVSSFATSAAYSSMGGGTGTGTGTKVSGSTTPTFKSPPTSLNLNFDNPYTTKGAFGRSIFGRTSYDFTGNEFQDKGIGNWEDVG
jgi:hypothetical protein